jgi:hypothetical protein
MVRNPAKLVELKMENPAFPCSVQWRKEEPIINRVAAQLPMRLTPDALPRE